MKTASRQFTAPGTPVNTHASSALQASRQPLQTHVITSEEEFDRLEEEWGQLVELANVSVFQTYEWIRTWWKYFGIEGDLRIITMRDNNELVAIVPLFLDRIKIAGIHVYRLLRLIGSNRYAKSGPEVLGLISYTDYLDLIIAPGYETTACKELTGLMGKLSDDVDEWLLESLKADSILINHLYPLLSTTFNNLSKTEVSSHQVVDLATSWDDYLMNNLSKNRRSHARRALKRIDDPERQVFTLTTDTRTTEIDSLFKELVQLHQAKWVPDGSLGAFGENRNLRFHQEVTRLFSQRGWAEARKVSPIDSPQEVTAVDINYRFRQKMYGIHCAVNTDSPHYNSSPGSGLLYATLREVSAENIESYDFLRGSESYKLVLATREESIYDVRVPLRSRYSERGRAWLIETLMTRRKLILRLKTLRDRAAHSVS